METIVIVLSTIIAILVVGIIAHIIYMTRPFRFNSGNLGELVNVVTKLNAGQYMDKTSMLVSDDRKTQLYFEGKFKFRNSIGGTIGLDPNIAYILCRDDGIYALDSYYNVLLHYKPTVSLVAGTLLPQTVSESVVKGTLKSWKFENGIFYLA